jgi:hypothetical protein
MPWIPGYKPARHFQGAIAEATGRYLDREPGTLDVPTISGRQDPALQDVFVPTPVLEDHAAAIPKTLRRMIRKFDPVDRDRRNRTLGHAGEQFVLEIERRQLADLSRAAPGSENHQWLGADTLFPLA